ncbi:hypothetical protein GWA97_12685 [Flavobacterium sp. LaA7.5]|nr:hypothetical protein [Flavobacterium salilacus subsp. altitudinum]
MIKYDKLTDEQIQIVKTLFVYENKVFNINTHQELNFITQEIIDYIKDKTTLYFALHNGQRRNADFVKNQIIKVLTNETYLYEFLLDAQVAVSLSIRVLIGAFDPDNTVKR